MNIGKVIHEFRTKLNISQTELAHRAGVSASLISLTENGYTKPREKSMDKIAKGLHIHKHIIYLSAIDESDVPPHKKKEYRQAHKKIKDLAFSTLSGERMTRILK